MKKRGLGRGLDALLGGVGIYSEQATEPAVPAAGSEPAAAPAAEPQRPPERLPVDLIERGRFQPRRDFDPESLQELADSIAAQGVIQPVVVRPIGDGRYELIAGERRWRATQLAGLADIPAVIREVNDRAALAIGLIENIQRDDLNPLEEATALDRLQREFELTHQEVAQAVGKSRVTVTNLLRLLDLNEDLKTHIRERRLEMGHARALLGLKGSAQSDAARQVVNLGLSVRETEKLVRRLQGVEEGTANPAKPPVREDPDVRRLLNNLTEKLGAKVDLQQATGGKGRLIISYNSLDELEGILDHIR